jgi:hypothetical protein
VGLFHLSIGCDADAHSLWWWQLIMREEELEGLDESCAASLSSLEILSLSHNRLPSLEHFQHLVNLMEVRDRRGGQDKLHLESFTDTNSLSSPQLNLNFNRITSLEGLHCTGLEKLFLSGNNVRHCPMQAYVSLAHACCVLCRVDCRRFAAAAAAQAQHGLAVRQPGRGPQCRTAHVPRSTTGAIAPNSQLNTLFIVTNPPIALPSCARWTWVAIRARVSSRATNSA